MQYLKLKSLTQKTWVLDPGTGLGILYLTRYFDSQSAFIYIYIYKESANFMFLKAMEMWEWINYFISHLKIQKQSLSKCPESVKSAAFNHFPLFQIPDLRAMESFVSPTVLIMDKILKKNPSAQFMFFTPNEVRNSRQAQETFSVYWNLISVKFSSFIVTVLA